MKRPNSSWLPPPLSPPLLLCEKRSAAATEGRKERGAMAKPSPAAVHTPRPASFRSSTRASVGSSSTPTPTPRPPPPLPTAASNSKGVAKCLAFDGDFTFPDAPADDLAPLLDLPDPADSSSSTTTALISAAPDDAVTASADSALTEVVTATAETTAMVEEEEEEGPLPDQISLALAELRGGRGLSPRSKRLVAALVEAAAAELCPSATTLRLRRAAFWVKVRVWILAATVATLFAIDVALAVALISRRGNDLYDAMPPT